jgi:hypothetical protein
MRIVVTHRIIQNDLCNALTNPEFANQVERYLHLLRDTLHLEEKTSGNCQPIQQKAFPFFSLLEGLLSNSGGVSGQSVESVSAMSRAEPRSIHGPP